MAQHSDKIYTRFGDQGNTKLFGDQIVAKDDLRVQTYGTLDELQSHLGLARAAMEDGSLQSVVYTIQKDLFIAGTELASAPETLDEIKSRITSRHVEQLEALIDQITEQYGRPAGFVTPGASFDSAALHVARSVCRRVERSVVNLNRNCGPHEVLIKYFNRLSDLIFMLAWSAQVRAAISLVLDGLMETNPK